MWLEFEASYMMRALELAARGQGYVEPNPMVGCTIVRDGHIVGEGWHPRFGAKHAEIEALDIAGPRAQGATMYVSLEPCCHQGKTPPCTSAIVNAGIRRVVAAIEDPFPQVAGKALTELGNAGIETAVGLMGDEARRLLAPYLKLVATSRPWVIGKWAMTLDGKIASRVGDSRWISNEASRQVVHQLRGRVDAILVGHTTAVLDDPLLTARPPGPRTATRIVVDSRASLPSETRLVQTAREIPLLVATSRYARDADQQRLGERGCEVFVCGGATRADRLHELIAELGRRRMTNILVEGGSRLLGSLFDERQLDEVHVFIGPRLVGGVHAPSPLGGSGIESIAGAWRLDDPAMEVLDGDVYVHGRTLHE